MAAEYIAHFVCVRRQQNELMKSKELVVDVMSIDTRAATYLAQLGVRREAEVIYENTVKEPMSKLFKLNQTEWMALSHPEQAYRISLYKRMCWVKLTQLQRYASADIGGAGSSTHRELERECMKLVQQLGAPDLWVLRAYVHRNTKENVLDVYTDLANDQATGYAAYWEPGLITWLYNHVEASRVGDLRQFSIVRLSKGGFRLQTDSTRLAMSHDRVCELLGMLRTHVRYTNLRHAKTQ